VVLSNNCEVNYEDVIYIFISSSNEQIIPTYEYRPFEKRRLAVNVRFSPRLKIKTRFGLKTRDCLIKEHESRLPRLCRNREVESNVLTERSTDTNEHCFLRCEAVLNTHVRYVDIVKTMDYLYFHKGHVTFALTMQILHVNGMNLACLRCNHNQKERKS
jgi:hypothetical protein